MNDILKYARANTVPSVNQMQNGVFFGDPNAKGTRILFAGNSITLHGVKEEIGWSRLCGMAASDEAHDYVHLTVAGLMERKADIAYAIAQASVWELNWREPGIVHEKLAAARDWNADIIVLRLSENTLPDGFDADAYARSAAELLRWLSKDGHARYVVTDGFWPHPEKDRAMYRAAQEVGAAFISLTDLGMREDMKALGLFWHEGVANHPGDKGMRAIAERMVNVIGTMLE